jgi:hypothetical protein
MDFDIKRGELIKYLDKNYTIIDGEFIVRYYEDTEWGSDIIKSLCVIFSIENEYSKDILKSWSFSNGLDEEGFKEALRPRTLRAEINLETSNDLMQNGLDVEQVLITILSEQLAKEIDMAIIDELRNMGKINNTDELLGVIKCIGYEQDEQVIYHPMTFTPIKKFRSIKRKKIENERNNNPIWQDWVRARRLYT